MISLNQVTKVFNPGQPNEVTALEDISVEFKEKEFVVLIGSNGSGKTTLLNVIEGSELPTSGTININGIDVSDLPEYKRSRWIARVFQNPTMGTAPDLSILDNFRLAALRTRQKKLQIGINAPFRKKVKDKIATLGMGLENKIEQRMGNLSGGQRQALTLLMSVMDDTNILLLDEPTAALDPKSSAVILKLADQLNKELNIITILITHNLKDAHQYGNRIIQFQEGKIVRDLGADKKSELTLPDIFHWFE